MHRRKHATAPLPPWELYQAWRDAVDETAQAYAAWCTAPAADRRDAFAVYRAAADREDAAALAWLSADLTVSTIELERVLAGVEAR